MGFDWESVLGTSGAGLDQAYDAAVSAVIYANQPEVLPGSPLPVGHEHDEASGLNG
ncbi:hypothetical protein ACIQUM_07935 [Amycolatopsis azurea]|uniref:hypothetical protein n=1 Tax=Amycolatopsis azurea TaxID=36819 RepID=UPI00380C2F67